MIGLAGSWTGRALLRGVARDSYSQRSSNSAVDSNSCPQQERYVQAPELMDSTAAPSPSDNAKRCPHLPTADGHGPEFLLGGRPTYPDPDTSN